MTSEQQKWFDSLDEQREYRGHHQGGARILRFETISEYRSRTGHNPPRLPSRPASHRPRRTSLERRLWLDEAAVRMEASDKELRRLGLLG